MGLIFILYFSLGTCKDKDKPSSLSVLETLRYTLTAYQNKLEDTSNEVTLALFGSIRIAFGLQQYMCFACNKGQKRGNADSFTYTKRNSLCHYYFSQLALQ